MLKPTENEFLQSDAERYRYLAQEMAERDYESAMYHRFENGRKQGFAEGVAEAKTKQQRIMARKMLKLGWSEEMIAYLCGMTEVEVRKIRKHQD